MTGCRNLVPTVYACSGARLPLFILREVQQDPELIVANAAPGTALQCHWFTVSAGAVNHPGYPWEFPLAWSKSQQMGV